MSRLAATPWPGEPRAHRLRRGAARASGCRRASPRTSVWPSIATVAFGREFTTVSRLLSCCLGGGLQVGLVEVEEHVGGEIDLDLLRRHLGLRAPSARPRARASCRRPRCRRAPAPPRPSIATPSNGRKSGSTRSTRRHVVGRRLEGEAHQDRLAPVGDEAAAAHARR